MNEEKLNQAARKYCELKRLNPDDILAHGAEPSANGLVCDVLLHSPRWMLVKEKIREIYLIVEAINYVK